MLGWDLLPWQRWLMIHALELLPDGRYRFRYVLVLVARQNGKTSAVEVKNLWKMFVQGAEVLGTAQDLDVSEESWDNAVEICEGIEELAAEIKDVVKTNGKKALKLNNGARWKVKAANRRGGRGFSGDDVNLDELREHQNWNAWGAVTKTTKARANAQVWSFTNAGDNHSVVLNSQQAKGRAALNNKDTTNGHFEWSAPDDTDCTCERVSDDSDHSERCRLADPAVWAQANPALGYTIAEETMWADLNNDPVEVFLTESLCVRVKDLSPGIIAANLWAGREDPNSTAEGWVGVAIDAAPDLVSAAIAMAGVRPDGKRHWQVLRHDAGSKWVVAELKKLRDEDKLEFGPVGLDSSGPAGGLVEDLREAKFEVVDVSGRTLVQAWGAFHGAVKNDEGRHLAQFTLDQAIRDAKNAPTGDVEKFSRKKSAGDICPIVAVTVADHVRRTTSQPSEPWALYA